jgi:hypothetical protein
MVLMVLVRFVAPVAVAAILISSTLEIYFGISLFG